MQGKNESAQVVIATAKVVAQLGRAFARPGPAARAAARALGLIAGYARLDLEELILHARLQYATARARASGRWS
jgi:hypothetical protein